LGASEVREEGRRGGEGGGGKEGGASFKVRVGIS